MTSCTQAECVPTSTTTRARPIQPLEKGCQILLRPPQLSFRQRFSLQTQNAVMAPLVAQICAHRQTVEIGAKLTALMLFSGARCCHLCRIQLFFQLSHQFRQHFFRIPLHRPRDFLRFDVGSLFFPELLCFFKVDLLSRFD